MVDLKIDSDTKRIYAEFMLKGEVDKLVLDIRKYQIVEENGETFVEISELETNREWLNIVFKNFLPTNRIPIPERFVPLLEISL